MAISTQNIKIEPCKVLFGEDVMQRELITCVADVAGSLNNKYYLFYTPAGAKHYVWLNVNSAGTDPAVSGGTAHEVAVATAATAAVVAAAIAAVVGAVAGFDATSDGAVVTVDHTTAGQAMPATDGAAPTAFSFEVYRYGDVEEDLGATDGELEVSLESNDVEVTSHQTGSEILDHINTGSNVGISVTIKETSVSQFRKVFLGRGDMTMPKGTGVTPAALVMGWGTQRQFKNLKARSRKLRLHPIALPDANKSRDLTFWKAFPDMESLTFSGEDLFMIPVPFKIYNDESKNPKLSKLVYGDSSQTLTA